MKKWIEIQTIEYWTSEDGDNAGKNIETHTIKVEENCDNLKKECEKELKAQQPDLNYHKIKSFKFI